MQSARKDEKIVKTNKIDPWRPEVPTRPRIKKMHEIIITVYVARTLRTHVRTINVSLNKSPKKQI